MTEQKKYHSPFMRIPVTKEGGEKIQEIQKEYDKFWRKMHRYADTSYEKFYAQKAMQESCQWLCRASAARYDATISEKPSTIKTFSSKDNEPVLDNKPQVIIKKKRI